MKKVEEKELEKLQQLNSEFVQCKNTVRRFRDSKIYDNFGNVQEIRSQFG